MPFSLIVSMDLKGGIGIQNKLPWHIPKDLQWLKKNTNNKIVIMGSNTYFSLPEKYRPLPNRTNIVLTTDQNKKTIIEKEGAIVESSINDILNKYSDKDCFIIGGANIYKQFINHVNYMYITKVAGNYNCDAFFPYFPKNDDFEWIEYETRSYIEEGDYVFKFLIFKRIIDYNDLDFVYNFYHKTNKDEEIIIDKNYFLNSKEYFKTIEDIKIYLRTNKIEKIRNMINEIKSSN